MAKVAVITGGCSGMGLETAKLLSSSGPWSIHLLDVNDAAAASALEALPDAHYHKVNVISHSDLNVVFEKIFQAEGRLDFVFANAGIMERTNFYEIEEKAGGGGGTLTEPDLASLAVNLNGVINTTRLGIFYMRKSPDKGNGAVILMTASCGGLYSSDFCPVYAASKAGVIHFMRSIAPTLHTHDGIRTHAICPGAVRTNILLDAEWSTFPVECFTPTSKVASTALMLVQGGQDLVDSNGRRVSVGKPYGLAVELSGENHYFREQVEWCDEPIRKVMEATSLENQMKSFEEAKKRRKAEDDQPAAVA